MTTCDDQTYRELRRVFGGRGEHLRQAVELIRHAVQHVNEEAQALAPDERYTVEELTLIVRGLVECAHGLEPIIQRRER